MPTIQELMSDLSSSLSDGEFLNSQKNPVVTSDSGEDMKVEEKIPFTEKPTPPFNINAHPSFFRLLWAHLPFTKAFDITQGALRTPQEIVEYIKNNPHHAHYFLQQKEWGYRGFWEEICSSPNRDELIIELLKTGDSKILYLLAGYRPHYTLISSPELEKIGKQMVRAALNLNDNQRTTTQDGIDYLKTNPQLAELFLNSLDFWTTIKTSPHRIKFIQELLDTEDARIRAIITPKIKKEDNLLPELEKTWTEKVTKTPEITQQYYYHEKLITASQIKNELNVKNPLITEYVCIDETQQAAIYQNIGHPTKGRYVQGIDGYGNPRDGKQEDRAGVFSIENTGNINFTDTDMATWCKDQFKEIQTTCTKNYNAHGGATLITCLMKSVKENNNVTNKIEIATAHVGDSAAYWITVTADNTVSVERLNKLHTPDNPAERARLEKMKGFIDYEKLVANNPPTEAELAAATFTLTPGRRMDNLRKDAKGNKIPPRSINHGLMMTRSIGDNEYYGTSHEPDVDVVVKEIPTGGKGFLFLTSDGFTDHQKDDIDYVKTRFTAAIAKIKPTDAVALGKISQTMGQAALSEDDPTTDNITIAIVEANPQDTNVKSLFVSDGHGQFGMPIAESICVTLPKLFMSAFKTFVDALTSTVSITAPVHSPEKERHDPSAKDLGDSMHTITNANTKQPHEKYMPPVPIPTSTLTV